MATPTIAAFRDLNPSDNRSDEDVGNFLVQTLTESGQLAQYPDLVAWDAAQKEAYNRAHRPGLVQEFTRSLASGTDTGQSMLYSTLAQGGAALGLRGVENFGLEGYRSNVQEAAENSPTVQSVGDIHGVEDAVRYGLGVVGTQAPMIGATLAASAAGGLAGGPAGAIAAGGAAGYAQMQNYGELVDSGGQDALTTSIAVGMLGGALESIVPAHIVNKAFGAVAKHEAAAATTNIIERANRVIPGFSDYLLKGVAKEGASEGLTEAAQEVVTMAGEQWSHRNDPNFKITDKEIFDRLINNAAAGVFLGGIFGAAEGVSDRSADIKAKGAAEKLRQIEQKAEENRLKDKMAAFAQFVPVQTPADPYDPYATPANEDPLSQVLRERDEFYAQQFNDAIGKGQGQAVGLVQHDQYKDELAAQAGVVSPEAAPQNVVPAVSKADIIPESAPAEIAAPEPQKPNDYLYTVQPPEDIPGTDKRTNAWHDITPVYKDGRREILSDEEKAKLPPPPAWLPRGQYTLSQINQAILDGPGATNDVLEPAPAMEFTGEIPETAPAPQPRVTISNSLFQLRENAEKISEKWEPEEVEKRAAAGLRAGEQQRSNTKRAIAVFDKKLGKVRIFGLFASTKNRVRVANAVLPETESYSPHKSLFAKVATMFDKRQSELQNALRDDSPKSLAVRKLYGELTAGLNKDQFLGEFLAEQHDGVQRYEPMYFLKGAEAIGGKEYRFDEREAFEKSVYAVVKEKSSAILGNKGIEQVVEALQRIDPDQARGYQVLATVISNPEYADEGGEYASSDEKPVRADIDRVLRSLLKVKLPRPEVFVEKLKEITDTKRLFRTVKGKLFGIFTDKQWADWQELVKDPKTNFHELNIKFLEALDMAGWPDRNAYWTSIYIHEGETDTGYSLRENAGDQGVKDESDMSADLIERGISNAEADRHGEEHKAIVDEGGEGATLLAPEQNETPADQPPSVATGFAGLTEIETGALNGWLTREDQQDILDARKDSEIGDPHDDLEFQYVEAKLTKFLQDMFAKSRTASQIPNIDRAFVYGVYAALDKTAYDSRPAPSTYRVSSNAIADRFRAYVNYGSDRGISVNLIQQMLDSQSEFLRNEWGKAITHEDARRILVLVMNDLGAPTKDNLATFLHEIAHHISKNEAPWKRRLIHDALDRMTDAKLKVFSRTRDARIRGENPAGLDRSGLLEEVLAEHLMAVGMSQTEARGILQRIIDAFKKVIAQGVMMLNQGLGINIAPSITLKYAEIRMKDFVDGAMRSATDIDALSGNPRYKANFEATFYRPINGAIGVEKWNPETGAFELNDVIDESVLSTIFNLENKLQYAETVNAVPVVGANFNFAQDGRFFSSLPRKLSAFAARGGGMGINVNTKGEIPAKSVTPLFRKLGISDSELEIYKSIGLDQYLLQNDGLLEGKIDVAHLAQWMENNAPRVEVKPLHRDNKIDPRSARHSVLVHVFYDTLPSVHRRTIDEAVHRLSQGQDFQTVKKWVKAVMIEKEMSEWTSDMWMEFEEYAKLTADLIKDPPETRALGAEALYPSIAPKNEMQDYVELLVRIPLNDLSGKTTADYQEGISGLKYKGPHFGEHDKNVLSFTRGYVETLPNGEKVFHVIEVQSDWAQSNYKKRASIDDEVLRDPINAAFYKALDKAESHPLLEDYEKLALKAAIDHAHQIGARYVAISDAETAMMTEGHDRAMFLDEPNLVHIPRSLVGTTNNDFGRLSATYSFSDLRMGEARRMTRLIPGSTLSRQTEPTQAPGMRAAYDVRLPASMEKLTKQKGTVVEFGKHKSVETYAQGFTAPMVEHGSPVFNNKTTVTARLYDVSNLDKGPKPLIGWSAYSQPESRLPVTKEESDARIVQGYEYSLAALNSQVDVYNAVLAKLASDAQVPLDKYLRDVLGIRNPELLKKAVLERLAQAPQAQSVDTEMGLNREHRVESETDRGQITKRLVQKLTVDIQRMSRKKLELSEDSAEKQRVFDQTKDRMAKFEKLLDDITDIRNHALKFLRSALRNTESNAQKLSELSARHTGLFSITANLFDLRINQALRPDQANLLVEALIEQNENFKLTDTLTALATSNVDMDGLTPKEIEKTVQELYAKGGDARLRDIADGSPKAKANLGLLIYFAKTNPTDMMALMIRVDRDAKRKNAFIKAIKEVITENVGQTADLPAFLKDVRDSDVKIGKARKAFQQAAQQFRQAQKAQEGATFRSTQMDKAITALNAARREYIAQLGIKAHVFEPFNGAPILTTENPNEVPKPGKLELGKDTMKAVTTLLYQNIDWLKANEGIPDDMYLAVEDQVEGLKKVAGEYVERGYRDSLFNRLVGSIPDRLNAIGHPLAKLAADRWFRYGALRRASEKLMYQGASVSLAVDKAMKAVGLSHGYEGFKNTFWNPANHFLEHVKMLRTADRAEQEQHFKRELYTYFSRNSQTRLGTAEFDTLWTALMENAALSKSIANLAAEWNVNVEDDDIKLIDPRTGREYFALRPAMDVGFLTTQRDIRKLFGIKNELDHAPGGIWAQWASDEKFDTLSNVSNLFTPEIVESFVKPYIYDVGTLHFDAPVAQDGETVLKAEPHNVQLAWDGSDGNMVQFANALFELENKGEPTDEARKAYILKTIGFFRGQYLKMQSMLSKQDSFNRDSLDVLTSPMMDNRKAEDLPSEFVDYRIYDQASVRHMLSSLAAHSAMGRDLGMFGFERDQNAGILWELDTVRNDLEKKMGEYTRLKNRFLREDPALSVKHLDKKIKDQLGEKEFNRIKNLTHAVKEIEAIRKETKTYFTSPNGSTREMSTAMETIHVMTGFMLNQPKSALSQSMQIFEPLIRYRMSSTGLTQVKRNLTGFLQSGMGSIVQGFTGQAHMASEVALHLNSLGLGLDPANMVTGAQILADRGANNMFEDKPVLGWLRKGRNFVFNSGMKPSDPRQRVAPAFRPWAPFSQTSISLNNAAMEGDVLMYNELLKLGMQFYKNNPEAFKDLGYALKAEDIDMDRAGYDDLAFKEVVEEMKHMGTTLEIEVRELLRQESEGKTLPSIVLSKELTQRVASRAVDKTSMPSDISTAPSWVFTSKMGRLSMPLLVWPVNKLNQIVGSVREPNGEVNRRVMMAAIATMLLGMIPASILVSLLLDQYDEKLLSKKSPLIGFNPNDPAQTASALVERLARVGTFGLAGDVVNGVRLYGTDGDSRGLSLDQRVIFTNVIMNLGMLVNTAIKQEGNLTYSTWGRPFLNAIGGGGVLQNQQIVNTMTMNLLGTPVFEKEFQVTARLNALNYLRGAGRTMNMDIRTGQGMGAMPNPTKPWISEMVQTTYGDDRAGFVEAYRKAVESARAEGREDPEDYVKRSYSSYHPLRYVFRTPPTKIEVRGLIGALSNDGQSDVQSALAQWEAYGNVIGVKAYSGKETTAEKSSKSAVNPYLIGQARRKTATAFKY